MKQRGLLDRFFYLFMAVLIAGVVAYGFSFTVRRNLLSPDVPRPFVLYVHAVFFSAWLLYFILQAALVRARQVRWHRRLGVAGAVFGAAIVVLGVATAITMGRFNLVRLGSTTAEADLLIPLFDMLAFSVTFALAVHWRRQPELHRRLMLVATCALTAAAFARMPGRILPPVLFYAGVDTLILLGIVRDLLVDRSVHAAYRWALPAFVAGQTLVMVTVVNRLEPWMAIGRALLR